MFVVHGRPPARRRGEALARRHRRAPAARAHPEREQHHRPATPEPHERPLRLRRGQGVPRPARQPPQGLGAASADRPRHRAQAGLPARGQLGLLQHRLHRARTDRRGGDRPHPRNGAARADLRAPAPTRHQLRHATADRGPLRPRLLAARQAAALRHQLRRSVALLGGRGHRLDRGRPRPLPRRPAPRPPPPPQPARGDEDDRQRDARAGVRAGHDPVALSVRHVLGSRRRHLRIRDVRRLDRRRQAPRRDRAERGRERALAATGRRFRPSDGERPLRLTGNSSGAEASSDRAELGRRWPGSCRRPRSSRVDRSDVVTRAYSRARVSRLPGARGRRAAPANSHRARPRPARTRHPSPRPRRVHPRRSQRVAGRGLWRGAPRAFAAVSFTTAAGTGEAADASFFLFALGFLFLIGGSITAGVSMLRTGAPGPPPGVSWSSAR